MLEKLPRPAVIAHRGASAHAPENTLRAVRLAVQHQAHAVELDVRLTADQQPIVIHDRSLDRTTSLSGLVSKIDFSALRAQQSENLSSAVEPSLPVPHLREALREFSSEIPINIELKSARLFPGKLPAAVSEVIRAFPSADLLISSFNPLVITASHRLLPQVPLGLILSRRSFSFWSLTGLLSILPISSVHPDYRDVSAKMISSCHARGLKIFPYTVNVPQDMIQLSRLGVDGFFTDDPDLALRTLSRALKVE
jgi:glycerophosphoryl diester phosphodiesterase